MDTPICNFIENYIRQNAERAHMPGHKGKGDIEKYDITEIEGADSLYEAGGIIKQSEDNASALFGCPTFYSTEGSSQCIRAMLYLCTLYAGGKAVIAAGRNAHKTFLSAAALLDFDIEWIYPKESYLSCDVYADELEEFLERVKPTALYLTSPDYLGNISDIGEISKICHKHGVLLAVDNAHGAYLRFLNRSKHPIDLGADICCDSAHKTLPVLTSGAYLHISENAPCLFKSHAKNALSLFGSTSPSYLILQSLDKANMYLSDYKDISDAVNGLKQKLILHGYTLIGNEPLKITFCTKEYGYTGYELGNILRKKGVEIEFADPDYAVLMLTPESDLSRLEAVLLSIEKRQPITESPPPFCKCERVLSVRQASFATSEEVTVKKAEGRILASASVGCPPAVPIVMCGERIDKNTVKCFEYYGIERVFVIK